ncbi:hypothetical protein OD350_18225 [Clostridium beijerinckii]|uniref:hypothetical protein n=1 Tax=Clostridium beijerinckii TaxID=1520 RepID=UPI0022269E8F|nr:hypothetical protein [Clostridium beijerinckii]UYZ34182.1 hypothetical protein OD350_18225 [Clostridium beijerinckii]
MPDITVTPELASIIKRERSNVTPRLSAKDLSKDIGKSETYISTLERGNIKNIEQETFVKIFEKIKNGSDDEFSDYLNNILNESLATIKYSKEELEKQKWMKQISLVIRKIPIHPSIVAFIKTSLDELEKTDIDLTNKINENTYFDDKDKYEDNTLYVLDSGWAYKFNISTDIVSKIITRKTKSTNYITMLGIIYNIFLLKGEDDKTASKHAKEFLQKNEFYNLDEIIEARQKQKETNNTNTNSDTSFVVPKYELEFDDSLKNISKYIAKLRDLNIDLAYSVIRTVEDNLTQYNKDHFIDQFYTIPFGKLLNDCSKEQKQEFLNRLFDLIKEIKEKASINNSKDTD